MQFKMYLKEEFDERLTCINSIGLSKDADNMDFKTNIAQVSFGFDSPGTIISLLQ